MDKVKEFVIGSRVYIWDAFASCVYGYLIVNKVSGCESFRGDDGKCVICDMYELSPLYEVEDGYFMSNILCEDFILSSIVLDDNDVRVIDYLSIV